MRTIKLDSYLTEFKCVNHIVDYLNETMVTDYEITYKSFVEFESDRPLTHVQFKFISFLGNDTIFFIENMPTQYAHDFIELVKEFLT